MERVKGVASKFTAAFCFDTRGRIETSEKTRERANKGTRGVNDKRQRVTGKAILFSVISLSPERDNFFSVFPPLSQLCVATYRMRGCVEIKYSRRELRPPLGLVVAWNSVDFIFALIRPGNQKYHISQKYSFPLLARAY